MTRQRVPKGEGGEGSLDDPDVPYPDDVPVDPEDPPEHIDGMLMIAFGRVQPGRETLAIDTFTELSRFLGKQVAEGVITAFKPCFYADGQEGGSIGFFLVEGHREDLDALRRQGEFVQLLLKLGAATTQVGVHTLIAGTQAGRLVHLYQQLHAEIGLL